MFRDEFKNGKFKSKHRLTLTLVSSDATAPSRCTPESVSYNIFTSDRDVTIEPGTSK